MASLEIGIDLINQSQQEDNLINQSNYFVSNFTELLFLNVVGKTGYDQGPKREARASHQGSEPLAPPRLYNQVSGLSQRWRAEDERVSRMERKIESESDFCEQRM